MSVPDVHGAGRSEPLRFRRSEFPMRVRASLPSTRPALGRAVRAVMAIARKVEGLGKNRTDLEIAVREALANAILHGNGGHKTKRVFEPNMQEKRFWVPSLNKFVRLRVSARAMRTIDKRGIDAMLPELKAAGVKF